VFLVLSTPRCDHCRNIAGWRDELEVRFTHGFPRSANPNCRKKTPSDSRYSAVHQRRIGGGALTTKKPSPGPLGGRGRKWCVAVELAYSGRRESIGRERALL